MKALTAESAGFVNLCSKTAEPKTINSKLPEKISDWLGQTARMNQ